MLSYLLSKIKESGVTQFIVETLCLETIMTPFIFYLVQGYKKICNHN